MSKEKKPLTLKQKKNRQRATQYACKVGEYVVIPVPFAALMIVNRDEWFSIPDNGWKIGLGASLTIALMLAAILVVVKESEDKHIANGYPLVIIKWIMACIIITILEDVLHTISSIMWVALSGLGASFGLDITRQAFMKKANETEQQIKDGEHELGKQQAISEIQAEQEKKKIHIKIKK